MDAGLWLVFPNSVDPQYSSNLVRSINVFFSIFLHALYFNLGHFLVQVLLAIILYTRYCFFWGGAVHEFICGRNPSFIFREFCILLEWILLKHINFYVNIVQLQYALWIPLFSLHTFITLRLTDI